MAPEEHNKIIGIMHLAYGGMHLFSLIVMIIMFLVIGIAIPFSSGNAGAPPAAFFGIMIIVVAVFTLILTIPPLIAGYGFLKRKSWSKAAGAISKPN